MYKKNLKRVALGKKDKFVTKGDEVDCMSCKTNCKCIHYHELVQISFTETKLSVLIQFSAINVVMYPADVSYTEQSQLKSFQEDFCFTCVSQCNSFVAYIEMPTICFVSLCSVSSL